MIEEASYGVSVAAIICSLRWMVDSMWVVSLYVSLLAARMVTSERGLVRGSNFGGI